MNIKKLIIITIILFQIEKIRFKYSPVTISVINATTEKKKEEKRDYRSRIFHVSHLTYRGTFFLYSSTRRHACQHVRGWNPVKKAMKNGAGVMFIRTECAATCKNRGGKVLQINLPATRGEGEAELACDLIPTLERPNQK